MANGLREDVIRQFEAQQSEQLGITKTQAGELTEAMRQANTQRDPATGGYNAGGQRILSDFMRAHPDIRVAQETAEKARAAASLSSAQARDPVGSAQLGKLTEIADVLKSRLKADEGAHVGADGVTSE
jgi:hypothetical protein